MTKNAFQNLAVCCGTIWRGRENRNIGAQLKSITCIKAPKMFWKIYFLYVLWGTGIRGLVRGMATLPQSNQELLVVRDKVGRPPGELGVSKSMECDIFPFNALTLLAGQQEGHPACKKSGVGLLVVIIWLELCTIYSSSCHHQLHHPLLQ